ncbi:MAG: MarR family transcriptional regulator [Ectothiorhodospiraceae bacterium]|nr:MarR family transcriptional regulator [Ectothiorhodospiraceae bacterium]
MRDPPSADAITAWARLLRAQTVLLDHVQVSLKAAGLPPLVWYDVLLELHRARPEGLRQYEIGERMLLSKSNLSRLLDRLVARSLIERRTCPEDARAQVVRITGAGHELLRRMWPVYGRCIRELVEARLEPAERRRLAELLALLVDGRAPR